MKQVSPKKYNALYWENFPFDFNRKLKLKDFGDVETKMSELLPLKETDTIVDLGCGTGQLSFYLALKYKCKVIGIDYSNDAIKIAQRNKKRFIENNKVNTKKIFFLNKTNAELTTFKNIKAVYLKDVIEHLYDEEINKILDSIKKWNNESIYIVIHTDNNLYLQYIRPFEDFINLFLHRTTKEKINQRNRIENERHVNLMTVNQVKKKLLKGGFRSERVAYATLTPEKIREQLRVAGQINFLLQIVFFSAKLLFFLRPSFFILAKYNKKLKN